MLPDLHLAFAHQFCEYPRYRSAVFRGPQMCIFAPAGFPLCVPCVARVDISFRNGPTYLVRGFRQELYKLASVRDNRVASSELKGGSFAPCAPVVFRIFLFRFCPAPLVTTHLNHVVLRASKRGVLLLSGGGRKVLGQLIRGPGLRGPPQPTDDHLRVVCGQGARVVDRGVR